MGDVIPGGWKETPQTKALEEFQPFSPAATWEGRQARPLDWMVEGAFIRGTVAILAGDGGLGKSLLLQQLITAAVFGMPWLGMATVPSRSLAVFCEDDVDELHRRQERINAHYGVRMKDLEPVMMESRPGRDCSLMKFERWGANGKKTVMFDQLCYAAKQHKANIIILDTLADVFDGNEVDRNQPRTFIRALRKLALETQGVVIITQHPSVEGMNSGSGRSGSTGWHNSVRSRLYLTTPKNRAPNDQPTNERWLRVMKQNAGKFGGHIRVEWDKGVFRTIEDAPPQGHWIEPDKDWRDG